MVTHQNVWSGFIYSLEVLNALTMTGKLPGIVPLFTFVQMLCSHQTRSTIRKRCLAFLLRTAIIFTWEFMGSSITWSVQPMYVRYHNNCYTHGFSGPLLLKFATVHHYYDFIWAKINLGKTIVAVWLYAAWFFANQTWLDGSLKLSQLMVEVSLGCQSGW